MGLETAKLLGRDHAIVLADLNEAALDAAVAELEAGAFVLLPAPTSPIRRCCTAETA